MKRTLYDATSVRPQKHSESDLLWKIAKLELRISELEDAIQPFAEADIESETNCWFAKAREVYGKRRK